MSTTTAAPVHAQQMRIALTALSPFKLNPRKHFGEAALNGLAASIKAQGVVQPILVRPNGGTGKYEIVVGERRWRASKLAGLTDIPANVRELTDAQALEVAVIENNQREDLHPLEEAEGYEALLKCKHEDGKPYTVDDIVAKIGRSRSYVYQKLKLCDLIEEGRKAFYAGKLDFSKAILLARIHGDELQKKALKEVTQGWGGEAMTARQAADHLQRNYMLALERAPFPIKDANLVAKAGACSECPKRTGNAPELFSDVKSGDVCTDPACFESKREAQILIVASQAKAKGLEVITGKDARRIAPHGTSSELKGYAALDRDVHTGDGGWKKLRAILGKDVPKVALLQDADTGTLVEVVKSVDVAPLLKAKLPKSTRSSGGSADSYAKKQREQEQRHKTERELRRRMYFAGRDHLAKKGLAVEDVRLLVANTWERLWHEHKKAVAPWWIEADDSRGKKVDRIEALTKKVATMGGEDLIRLLVDCSMVYEIQDVNGHGGGARAANVEAFARRHGVDTAAIKRQASSEQRVKAAAKKAKSGKAKAKAKKK
jgi:ParB/RepB/Spo0J family partition protein